MPKNLTELRECISRIRPWAVVAMLGAAVLLGFYTYQGIEYWNAWNDAKTMTSDIERVSRKLDKGVPSSEDASQNLTLSQQRLEYLEGLFHYPDAAKLMGITSTTSWDSGIDLPSISAGDPTIKKINGMEYRVQVLSLTAKGALPDIYRFLAALHQRVKVVSVPSINMSNLGSEEASAQVQLSFYLSPEPISGEKGAD